MQYSKYSDEELIELFRQGEKDVEEYLLEKYKPLVRKKTNAMYLIGAEMEDLLQEGMIGLFKGIRDFQQEKGVTFYHFAELRHKFRESVGLLRKLVQNKGLESLTSS